MGKYKKSPGVHSQDSNIIDIFIYGTLNDSLGALNLQSINGQIVYSEKTTSTSGIIWKLDKTIIIQKCFKALSDLSKDDVIITLPYDCYWSYLLGKYGDKSIITVIRENSRDLLIDETPIRAGDFFFVCGTVVIK